MTKVITALHLFPMLLLAAVSAARNQDSNSCPSQYEVTSLPGLNETLNFRHYSGFMPLGDTSGTEIFFWFVESQDNPTADPVTLWMNGGPGSSSIAYGFWSEHGPFRLNASTKNPELYEHSWNLHSNIIYIEAPAGVGFSYSKDPSHYVNITDAQSSYDNYQFLLKWFECFEDFKGNEFFITAESYGGHYGPTLAEQIIDNNDTTINMKGLLIGNPGINSDWYYNVNEFAFVTFMYGHALIPSVAYEKARIACGWETFLSDCSKDFTHPSGACLAATSAALQYIPSPLDPYNVLAKTCHENVENAAEADMEVQRYTPFLHRLREVHNITGLKYNPCINDWTPAYLNRKDVLHAIHADVHYTRTWPEHPKNWSYDEGVLGAKKNIALLFPKFFKLRPNWKIAVISGDADAAVPFLGTERWINCLNRPVTNDWRKWTLDGDVAGMIKDWDKITFVTVKGCGHTIPTYCPKAGYAFYANWLSNNWNETKISTKNKELYYKRASSPQKSST